MTNKASNSYEYYLGVGCCMIMISFVVIAAAFIGFLSAILG